MNHETRNLVLGIIGALVILIAATVIITDDIKDRRYCESRNGVYVNEHCFKKELFNEN